MLVVPLQPIANQTVQAQLNNQACTISVFQYAYGLFITLYVGNTLIVASVICENLVLLVLGSYLGFSGNLLFVDTQGEENPVYTGFGPNGRFQLVYLSPQELQQLQLVSALPGVQGVPPLGTYPLGSVPLGY